MIVITLKIGGGNMKKDKYLQIRLNEEEYNLISKKAELLNISMSDFVRQAVKDKKVKGYDKKIFRLW